MQSLNFYLSPLHYKAQVFQELSKKLDTILICGYNVTIMTTYNTKLVADGNSTAVRLPKVLLQMSGLSDNVELEAKNGQIIISSGKQPRHTWQAQIDKIMAEKQHDLPDKELADWDETMLDGLENER